MRDIHEQIQNCIRQVQGMADRQQKNLDEYIGKKGKGAHPAFIDIRNKEIALLKEMVQQFVDQGLYIDELIKEHVEERKGLDVRVNKLLAMLLYHGLEVMEIATWEQQTEAQCVAMVKQANAEGWRQMPKLLMFSTEPEPEYRKATKPLFKVEHFREGKLIPNT